MLSTALVPTLTDRHLPNLDRRLAALFQVLTGSLLIAALAQVRIPLPFTPVPITGQTFAVLLVAATLGVPRGVVSVILYLGAGLAGLPVFAGGVGGAVQLAGPTGGYLIGFLFAAYLVGWLAERGLDRSFGRAWLVFLAGEAVIYLFGLPWLGFYVGLENAPALGLYPFLVGDAVKLAGAALALPAAWRLARPGG